MKQNLLILFIILLLFPFCKSQTDEAKDEKNNSNKTQETTTESQTKSDSEEEKGNLERADEDYKDEGALFEMTLSGGRKLLIRNSENKAELYYEEDEENTYKISDNILNKTINKPNILVSFDEQKVAYLEDKSDQKKASEAFHFDLYVFNMKKKETILVESNVSEWYYTYFSASLSWSPNSEYLLYRLYNTFSVIHIESNEIVFVELGVSPKWSEDGNKVAYIELDPLNFSDYLVYYDDGIRIYSKQLVVYNFKKRSHYRFSGLEDNFFYEEINDWKNQEIKVNVIQFDEDPKTIISGNNHDARVLKYIKKRFVFTYIYEQPEETETEDVTTNES